MAYTSMTLENAAALPSTAVRTSNPQPSNLNLKPETRNPKLETLNPEP